MIQHLMRGRTSAEFIVIGAVNSRSLLKLCHLEENKQNTAELKRQIQAESCLCCTLRCQTAQETSPIKGPKDKNLTVGAPHRTRSRQIRKPGRERVTAKDRLLPSFLPPPPTLNASRVKYTSNFCRMKRILYRAASIKDKMEERLIRLW